jgi:hypothetical protein
MRIVGEHEVFIDDDAIDDDAIDANQSQVGTRLVCEAEAP